MTDKLKDIKTGDRVRVTFEGVFHERSYGAVIALDGTKLLTTEFLAREINAPTFTIEKLATPLAVGDRVRVGTSTGSIIAFDGEAAVIKWGAGGWSPHYRAVPTTQLVLA